MTFACAPSHIAQRALAFAGVDVRALAIVVMLTPRAIVAPPRSPGPGRP